MPPDDAGALPLGWSQRSRSVYESDTAVDFANWLNKRLAELPDNVKNKAIMTCTALVDGGFMVGIRHTNVDQYPFWFDAKRYMAWKPSMLMADIVKHVNASTLYHVYEERDGGDVPWGHGERVDLRHEPRFYAAPPATMRG